MRPNSPLSMLLLLLPCFAGGAGAAAPVWICTLTADAARLVCVADIDPLDASSEPVPAPAAVVNGTAFPLDPRRVYSVDLWSPATDMEFVAQLARATICYRTPGCNVVLAGAAAGAPAAPAGIHTARRR